MKRSKNKKINFLRAIVIATIGFFAISRIGNDIEVRDGFSPLLIQILLSVILIITITTFLSYSLWKNEEQDTKHVE